MLYVKLARHMGTTGSPIPTLHGEHVGFLGVVYPIVLAPFYGGLDNVAAFTAAHAVNAVLFASAAIPAYLLARRLVSPGWALVVALLCVSVPWAVNAAFVMSEAAAYPVFLWAVLACHVCDRRALAALGRARRGRAGARVLHPAPVPLPRRGAAARGPDHGWPAAGVSAAPPAGDRLRGRRPPGGRAGGARPGAPPARRLRRDRDPGLAAARDRLEIGGDPRRRAGRRARRRAAAARRRLGLLGAA